MRKAIVDNAGVVMSVIELNDGAEWAPPDGYEVIDAVSPAQPGGTWDGSKFIAPVRPVPARLDSLMAAGPATQVYDEATETMVGRPTEDMAADKAELLGLLQTKLAETEDLTWEQMNKMLALERES